MRRGIAAGDPATAGLHGAAHQPGDRTARGRYLEGPHSDRRAAAVGGDVRRPCAPRGHRRAGGHRGGTAGHHRPGQQLLGRGRRRPGLRPAVGTTGHLPAAVDHQGRAAVRTGTQARGRVAGPVARRGAAAGGHPTVRHRTPAGEQAAAEPGAAEGEARPGSVHDGAARPVVHRGAAGVPAHRTPAVRTLRRPEQLGHRSGGGRAGCGWLVSSGPSSW